MDNKKPTIEQKIKNRTNWFLLILLVIVIVFALIVAAVKILDFKISVVNIDFSTLLSVIIAFFAIGLSVAFYNMASKSSDKFYSDIFGFIKSISESIGQMDSKLTEKMNKIDDGQKTLQTQIVSNSDSGRQETLKKQREEYDAKIEEQNYMIDTLLEDNQLNQEERDKYKSELEKLRKEIKVIKSEIETTEKEDDDPIITFASDEGIYKYRASDIVYIIGGYKNVLIYNKMGEPVSLPGSLTDLEYRLPEMFVRCNNSNIVNVNHVLSSTKDNTGGFLELTIGHIIPMSEKYYESVMNKIKERHP